MAYRSSSTNANTGSQQLATTAVPAGVQVDDIVVLVLTNDNGADPSVVWPSGFAQLDGKALTVDGQWNAVAWKRLTAVDSGSYSVSWTGGVPWELQAFAFSGRDTVNPPTISTWNFNSFTTITGTVIANGVTALAGDDLLWIDVSDATANSTYSSTTAPAGYTKRQDQASGWEGGAGCTQDNVGAGATGTVSGTMTLTATNNTGWGCWLIRIPASAGAPAPPVASYQYASMKARR